MREVTLPAPLDRSLDSILEVLAGNPPARELRLGGGTALATIWAHRFSTDIDLVCSNQVYRAAMPSGRRKEIVERLRQRRNEGERISGITSATNLLGWKTATGAVSLVPSRLGDFPKLWGEDVIKNTGVRLASVEAILHGKLLGRLVGAQRATARDGYDFAVGLLVDRPKVEWVLRDQDDRASVVEAARRAAGRLSGRPLLRPAFPEIAADPWGEAIKILEGMRRSADYERTTPFADTAPSDPPKSMPPLKPGGGGAPNPPNPPGSATAYLNSLKRKRNDPSRTR